jgi:hypothetical protein
MAKQPKCLQICNHFLLIINPNDNPSIQLPNYFTFKDFSTIQAINVTNLVYHFQCPSFDVTLYPQTSQLVIEHLIPIALLTFITYV